MRTSALPMIRGRESIAGQDRMATLYRFNPLHDPRWSEFVQTHEAGGIFHTSAWLEALYRTYGYDPLVFTTCPPDRPLTNGIAFSCVRSWLTGSRLVSVAFADHCEPLASSPDELNTLLSLIQTLLEQERCRYLELRPLSRCLAQAQAGPQFGQSAKFLYHSLDLRPGLNDLFGNLHKSGMQRKIRRAEREGLTCEEGRSEAILRKFYSLLVRTRQRHGVPPQPLAWFRNLIVCLGEALNIRIASRQGVPVASMLTLRYKGRLTYKYGCSDERLHALGGVPLLFWRAIEEAKLSHAEELDLGRSDLDNPGLINFKEHLGATGATLTYFRYPGKGAASAERHSRFLTKLWSRLPSRACIVAGSLLYRHMG